MILRGVRGISQYILEVLFQVNTWAVRTTLWGNFWDFSEVPDHKRWRGTMPKYINMGAENMNFLELLKTMIVGALWFRLGLLCMRILFFLQKVTAPNVGSSQKLNLVVII